MTATTGLSEARQQAAPAQLSPAPSVRTAIAILVTRFPRIDETFILREINELERHGQPVVLIPLLRNPSTVIHEEAKPWMGRALYMPLLSFAILFANLKRMILHPRRYFGLLAELIAGTVLRPSVLLRTLALFPKSVYLAGILPRMGIRHVHAHFAVHPTTMAYIISRFSDITYSFTVHGPDVFVHRLLLREKIAGAKFVRAVCTFVKAYVTGLYPNVSRGKIDVVHIGVNPDVYAEEAAAAKLHTRTRVLSVASLSGAKGFSFLIDACARLIQEGVDLECVIVGHGPMRPYLAAQIKESGLEDRIRMTGALPQHEVARHVAECDIFVLPSVIAYNGQMDGVPISLMEAMAAGRPVIASAISGIPELVQPGVNGILVDATHVERIAESIRLLVNDPALRERLGRAGQETVRGQFDVRRTSLSLIDLFERHSGRRLNLPGAVAKLRWDKLETVAIGLQRIRVRQSSIITELSVTDGISKRNVVVKQQRERDVDWNSGRERALLEVDALKRLRASMDVAVDPEPGIIYSVPRVLFLDAAQGAFVMERAQGQPLDRLISTKRNRGMASRLIIPLRRAGTWLRRMQTATSSGGNGSHLLESIEQLALRDLELAASEDRAVRKQCARVQERLQELIKELSDKPMPLVGCHGDYKPANVFVAGPRVDVVDLVDYRDGLPLEDVASFLVNLRLRFALPFLGPTRVRMEQSFLNGYAGGEAIDPDALRLFMIVKSLQLLACENEGPRFKAWLHHRALRQILFEAI